MILKTGKGLPKGNEKRKKRRHSVYQVNTYVLYRICVI